MQTIETIVRQYLARLLKRSDPMTLDLHLGLSQGLGLSSLDIVLLISQSCKEAKIPMILLAEEEVAQIKTGFDFVQLLASKDVDHVLG